MTAGDVVRRWALTAAALVIVASSLLTAEPAQLVLDADLAAAGSNSTFLELHKPHYGASAAGFAQACGEFTESSTVGAPRFDGWGFVTRANASVVTFQVVFRDRSGTVRTYGIRSNGTSVTVQPGPGGRIAFSKDFSHITVLTPDPGGYRLLKEKDPALIDADGSPYSKTMFSRTLLGTDESTVGYFNLSHTCSNRPLIPPHSNCVYPDDAAVLTAPTTFSGVSMTGKLTCNGVPQSGQTVTARGDGSVVRAVTAKDGSFTLNLPVGKFVLSFSGTSTVPAATPLSVQRTA